MCINVVANHKHLMTNGSNLCNLDHGKRANFNILVFTFISYITYINGITGCPR